MIDGATYTIALFCIAVGVLCGVFVHPTFFAISLIALAFLVLALT